MNTHSWFHATTQPEWLSTVQTADAWVHVGSLAAANERASRVTRHGLRVLEEHFLWKVELDATARVYPSYVEDLDENWESLETGDWDVFVYRNAHENAGSISLYMRASAMARGERLPSILPS